jgi:hypothetical protein
VDGITYGEIFDWEHASHRVVGSFDIGAFIVEVVDVVREEVFFGYSSLFGYILIIWN